MVFAFLKTKFLENLDNLHLDYKIGNSPTLLDQILTNVTSLCKSNNKIVKFNLF